MHTVLIICVQKVGVVLKEIEVVQKLFENVGEIAKTADFVSEGFSNYEVSQLCKQGIITRIRNGYYQLSQSPMPKEEELLEKLVPQGIVCVESALFYYGYSDFAPREWTIAVPRSSSRTIKRMQEVPIKAYYVQEKYLNLGKVSGNFNGTIIPVYDRERTICDCFKYRTKLDHEIFNKAITTYAKDDEKNLSHLSKYARELHVYEKLMNVMEILLTV